jgi:uncharacterized protein (TIGR00725 family)
MSIPEQRYVGFSGPGRAEDKLLSDTYELGKQVALHGWILVSGGRNKGTMDSANKGAFEAGGRTVGILPGRDREGVSRWVKLSIVEGDGQKRNVTIVNSSDIIVAAEGATPGTNMEINCALKLKKNVILLHPASDDISNFYLAMAPDLVRIADSVGEAIGYLEAFFAHPLV